MSDLSTEIRLKDGLTTQAQAIVNSLNSITGAFQNVSDITANGIDNSGVQAMQPHLDSVLESARTLQSQLNEFSNFQWNTMDNIEIFHDTGIERFQQEMSSLTDLTDNFTRHQAQISEQARMMDILPASAKADIEAVNSRIQNLGERITQMQNIDTSMLNGNELNSLNSQYEQMRGTLFSLVETQHSMNAAMESGDLSELNEQFNRVNKASHDFERSIRDNTQALQALTTVEWASVENIELFNGNDVERFQQEVNATNSELERMNVIQAQVSNTASNMTFLPANAIKDINSMGDRISTLQTQLEAVRETRIEVVGIEQANSEMEALREQLRTAVRTQEDMNNALDNMDISGANQAYQQLNTIVSQTEREIRNNVIEQERFNEGVRDAKNSASGLKSMIGGIVALFSVRTGVNFIRQSVTLTNENIRLEQQLANVMANKGATQEEYNRLLENAAQIQSRTNDMMSATSMMGAANELARHVENVEAIEIMMGSLADFAAGAGDIFGATAETMAGYAEYFTQAMAGNYRMLERRAGIYLTEAQRQVIKYADDMQRALLIQDVVNQSWEGLADQMARTPQGMLVAMRNAFDDIRSSIGAQLLPAIMQLFEVIYANMPQIQTALYAIVPIIQNIITLVSHFVNIAFQLSDVIINNWGMIEPVIWGIVGAIAAMKIMKMMATLKTAALTAAVIAKNMVLLQNPIGLVVVAIGAIIGAIVRWVKAVGGLQIAWLITVNAVKTGWENLKSGFNVGVTTALIAFDKMRLGMAGAGAGIANSMETMRANVLESIQNMVNGAIDLLNRFISRLNTLRFVNISAIDQVVFGTRAQIQAEANNQQRDGELEQRRNEMNQRTEDRLNDLKALRESNAQAQADRLAEIQALREAQAQQQLDDERHSHGDFVEQNFQGNQGFGSGGGNVNIPELAGIGGNVGNIAQDTREMVGITQDNLKYWRDIAERENINRFTTASVELTIPAINNNVSNNMDLDDIVEYLVDGFNEALGLAAERSNAYV